HCCGESTPPTMLQTGAGLLIGSFHATGFGPKLGKEGGRGNVPCGASQRGDRTGGHRHGRLGSFGKRSLSLGRSSPAWICRQPVGTGHSGECLRVDRATTPRTRQSRGRRCWRWPTELAGRRAVCRARRRVMTDKPSSSLGGRNP